MLLYSFLKPFCLATADKMWFIKYLQVPINK